MDGGFSRHCFFGRDKYLNIDGGGRPSLCPECDQHLSIPVHLSPFQSHTRGIGVRKCLNFSNPSRRLLPSHGRGHWFNPSRAHHFTLCIQRPVAVVPDCLPQETLLDTLMTQLRSQNGYDPKERQPL